MSRAGYSTHLHALALFLISISPNCAASHFLRMQMRKCLLEARQNCATLLTSRWRSHEQAVVRSERNPPDQSVKSPSRLAGGFARGHVDTSENPSALVSVKYRIGREGAPSASALRTHQEYKCTPQHRRCSDLIRLPADAAARSCRRRSSKLASMCSPQKS